MSTYTSKFKQLEKQISIISINFQKILISCSLQLVMIDSHIQQLYCVQ